MFLILYSRFLQCLYFFVFIYFALTDRISSSVVRVGHKDGKDVEPALDYILMRDDLYERILETSRELPSL